jgi:hypothetical protein
MIINIGKLQAGHTQPCESHPNLSLRAWMRYATILLIAALVVLTAAAQTRRDPTVYITRTRHTYHKAQCPYLDKTKTAVKLSAAKKHGYMPCPLCYHPSHVIDPPVGPKRDNSTAPARLHASAKR